MRTIYPTILLFMLIAAVYVIDFGEDPPLKRESKELTSSFITEEKSCGDYYLLDSVLSLLKRDSIYRFIDSSQIVLERPEHMARDNFRKVLFNGKVENLNEIESAICLDTIKRNIWMTGINNECPDAFHCELKRDNERKQYVYLPNVILLALIQQRDK